MRIKHIIICEELLSRANHPRENRNSRVSSRTLLAVKGEKVEFRLFKRRPSAGGLWRRGSRNKRSDFMGEGMIMKALSDKLY